MELFFLVAYSGLIKGESIKFKVTLPLFYGVVAKIWTFFSLNVIITALNCLLVAMLHVIQDLPLIRHLLTHFKHSSGDNNFLFTRDQHVKILKSLQIKLHTNQYPMYYVCELNIFEISHCFFCSLLLKTPHYSTSWCSSDIHYDQLLVLRDVNKFCTNKLKWRIKKNKHLFLYIIVASLYWQDKKNTWGLQHTVTYADMEQKKR